MKIAVVVKQVPDSETRPRVAPDGTRIIEEGVSFVLNPYDEYGVEEALKLKERFGGDSEVVLLTLGPKRVQESLRTALAMGVDRAVHIHDEAARGSDIIGVACILAAALKQEACDLILCGKQAIDDDMMAVGPAMAEFLGPPQATVVTDLTVSDDGRSAVAQREVEGATEVVELSLPAVITCQKGLNEPRYPSLPGIMKAKKKEIKELSLADLGLEPARVGAGAAMSKITGLRLPPPRGEGKVFTGEVGACVDHLIAALREEVKLF